MSGRGELHLAILIERMRREGYELQCHAPSDCQRDRWQKLVPYDQIFIEVPEAYSGAVIQNWGVVMVKYKI